MNWKSLLLLIIGIFISLLGILWFLQGSDLVHIKPILCFADCEPIVGKSLEWQIAGIAAFIIGTTIIAVGRNKKISYKSY